MNWVNIEFNATSRDFTVVERDKDFKVVRYSTSHNSESAINLFDFWNKQLEIQ